MSSPVRPAGFAGLGDERPRRPARRFRPELSVETLPGVGPKVARRLAGLGIETVGDLVEHVPRAYDEWREARGFAGLALDEEATVRCVVERVSIRPTRRRNLKIVQAVVRDGEGTSVAAVWFNQTWVARHLGEGTELLVHGRLAGDSFRVERHELAGDDAGRHTVGLVPAYPASEEVSSAKLRDLHEAVRPQVRFVPDPLPARLRLEEGLPLRADALAAVHRPADRHDSEVARSRLSLEELVALQVGFLRRRRALEDVAGAQSLGEDGDLVARYRDLLPFTLTSDQEGAIREIAVDLAGTRPMQRLLQGDVGSGKTVVALYALLRAVDAGHQAALMAPTETLAEQHFLTVEGVCNDLAVRCELLTSSVPAARRRAALGRLATGEVDLAVGTHALIQEEVEFRSLAVAVVDEQHRFGVEQRRALGRATPHVLHMTATPIPRSLAQAIVGDLDVTEIARPPADRKPVVTRWVSHERSGEAYTRLRRHLGEGRQAYVVCPLVSESESVEARAAEQEADRLRVAELSDFRVGCLHGKLRPAERREIMAAFKRRELDVLVATTVIEVGVDVPNATIMIVQEADRFGLAQLHQLRGRVGRGAEQSYCLLVSRPKDELTEEATRRLEALVRIADGFRLAEVDLELRGEGQLLGTRQSGRRTDLRFARLVRDRHLIPKARAWAERLVDGDPDVLDPLVLEAERLADHRGFA